MQRPCRPLLNSNRLELLETEGGTHTRCTQQICETCFKSSLQRLLQGQQLKLPGLQLERTAALQGLHSLACEAGNQCSWTLRREILLQYIQTELLSALNKNR